ncbi:MAG: ABC transporter permease [Rhodospirillales bacterium]|nr:ABC transporter permease [Rhodospirillales bacterium]
MLAFVAQRIAQTGLVMLTVAFVAFAMFHFIGDPINNMVSQDATAEQREQVRRHLGLDDPFPLQFAYFISNAVHGDFGVSYRLSLPVGALIAERLPATLELVFVAASIALLVGMPLGVYTGLYRRGVVSRLLLGLTLVGISLPTFLTGLILILIFSLWLGWLPSFGRGEVVDLGIWSTGFLTASGRRALVLPSITLALFQLALITRLVRAGMLEVLGSDYIRFARARGLPNRLVLFGHALKNTLVPVMTNVGLQIGALIAFAIITETVFQWPGMGLLFLQAIRFADIPVMAAYLMLTALLFGVINLAVDLLYGAIDPRVRGESSHHKGS